MKQAMVDAGSYARLPAVQPLGRMGENTDGTFHEERADFFTGETLQIDGGQSAGHRDLYQPSPSRPRKRE
jgi:hypothetical protein